MTLLPSLLLALAPLPAPQDPVDVLHLELPPANVARPVLAFELEGRPRRVRLRLADVRAADFEVRAWTEAGMRAVDAPEPSVWTGEFVDGEERLVARRTPDGFDGWIVRADGTALRLEPLPALAPGAHRVAVDSGLAARCGAEDDLLTQGGSFVPPPAIAPELRPACLVEAEIAYDCDYQYYKGKASSVDLTVATVELYTELVNAFFVRDVLIRHRITAVVVRTAPFYFPNSGGHLLDLFRAEWNTNQSGVPRDLAHLMTGKSGGVIEYGGLAWVGVVCNVGLAYAWSMDSPNIVGHEVGHNWGAGHCHDVTPCNNMCGACFLVAPNTKEIIEAYRDNVGCLDPVLPDPGVVPPYAMPDALFVRKREQNGPGARLDVLVNDHDGSCERVSLAAVESPTPRGAEVAVLPGGGPGGRDVLLYGTGDVPVLGVDPFTYTAADPGGATTVGTVEVTALPLDLAAYWPFDEGGGSSAADLSRFGRDGALENGAGWGAGVYGGGLALDGGNDHVSVPSLDVPGDELSITAWVRREGGQPDWAGIVFSRAAGTEAGLRLGKNDELRYQWNDDPVTRAFDPGFQVPDGIWCFVALVVRPERAILYLDDGGGLQSAEHVYPHVPQTFSGTTYVGWDPANTARHFGGALDDVRVHDHALVRKQIERLVDLGGRAVVPTPADGGSQAVDGAPLTWVASPLADAHEVYLGADLAAVRDADTTDSEYQGSYGTPSFTAPPLPPGETRFWRVDEVVGAQRSKGEVWQLVAPRLHHWRLDETSGTTAVDSAGAKDGTYKNDVTLGEPGATGKTGTSVRLDGADDRVRIPKLKLDDNRFTVAGWVRLDGAQDAFAGLFFCRGGSTAAGLHLGDAGDLRYTWEDAHSDWSSGLTLPDDPWVFVALVVEPSRATIYLGQGGLLSVAEHPASHGPEAFDAVSSLGSDPAGGRLFRGWVDDWRAFAGALTFGQVQALYSGSL